MAEDTSIRVVVRVRPLNSREIGRGAKSLVRMEGNTTFLDPPEPSAAAQASRAIERDTKQFSFDHSYNSAVSRDDPLYASQDTLYQDLGRDLLEHSFQGFNCTIFAYGQTGSGKSYSMMGYGADRGLIPLICSALFDRIAELQSDSLSYTVEVSFLEIYQERVRDLLNPQNKGNLRVREHPSTGPYVEDLSRLAVQSFSDIEHLMDEGNKARTVAATKMNETSSRSHSLFTVMLTQRKRDDLTGMSGEKVSRISLVDLAGSERANSTGATGQRLKEGAQINKSLTTLGKVIAALAQASSGKGRKGKDDHVPYRDSVLTWLLKDSLGGNSKTAMIAAISPSDDAYEETLSTLRYADQAKKIKTKARVNEDPNAKLIRELKEELLTLRARMSGATSEAVYDPSVPPSQQIVSYMNTAGEVKTITKAELQDQLEQSEKLMAEVAQTWEEKLQKTQEVQKQREEALEALGIVIERNLTGIQTPKKVPHLVNLAEDPLADGCLLWMIKPGRTMVGNAEGDKPADIRLRGDNVLAQHCYFETNADGSVELFAMPDSATLINGQQLKGGKSKRLHSGYRIIVGFHAFRFNHPEEVRKQRDRESTNGSARETMRSPVLHDLAAAEGIMSPAQRPGSPMSVADAPDEHDWSYARREAVVARLGTSVDLATIADDDLDQLFDEITRVKQHRRTGTSFSRPASRLSSALSSVTGDEHSDDASDGVVAARRPLSTMTWSTDETSLAETEIRAELETQLEAQRVQYEAKLAAMVEQRREETESRTERGQMEAQLQLVQTEMQGRIDAQRREYETRVQQLSRDEDAPLTPIDLARARTAIERWRRLTRVRMAEAALVNAAALKEANIISRELSKDVVYQHTIVDALPLGSPTSAVEAISGLAELDEGNDPALERAIKPCMAVRVLDRRHRAIYTWSIERLQSKLAAMRTLTGFVDRAASARHLDWDAPFFDANVPTYSFLGAALVSLAPLSRSVALTTTATVFSRYTGQPMATCRVRIKPLAVESEGEVPSRTLPIGGKLSVELAVSHVRGLSGDELVNVHCQARMSAFTGADGDGEIMPSSVYEVAASGSTALKLTRTFALPITATLADHLSRSYVPIELFGQIKPALLDHIALWDSTRERKPATSSTAAVEPVGRIAEVEFETEMRHDVVASVQICELAASGEYVPVPLVTNSHLDPGAFFLRQGLQRRIILAVSHGSGGAWRWTRVSDVTLGDVRWLDARGLVHASPSRDPLELRPLRRSVTAPDADGKLHFTAHWDSSIHDSPYLDRPTAASTRALIRLSWSVDMPGCSTAVPFALDLGLTVQTRDARAPGSLSLGSLLSPSSVRSSSSTRATAVFAVKVAPAHAAKTSEIWRRDSGKVALRGEEVLGEWRPRGVSLVHDHDALIRIERRLADVEATKAMLASWTVAAVPAVTDNGWHSDDKLHRVLDLWRRRFGPREEEPSASRPPIVAGASQPLVAESRLVPRSAHVAKRSHLAILRDPSSNTWTRRFAVLRRPYLYLYDSSSSAELDPVDIINVSAVRVDVSAELEAMLKRRHLFALYTSSNSFFVQASSAADVQQWLSALDPSSHAV